MVPTAINRDTGTTTTRAFASCPRYFAVAGRRIKQHPAVPADRGARLARRRPLLCCCNARTVRWFAFSAVLACLVTCHAGKCMAEEKVPRVQNIICDLPIEKDGGFIFVRASVERLSGEPNTQPKLWTFLLDTGTDRCIIDDSHRGLLGAPLKEIKNWTATDGSMMQTFTAADLHIGDLTLKPVRPFGCFDMSRHSQAIGEPLDGVLGIDSLRTSIIEIDFDNGRLRFLRSFVADDAYGVPLRWKLGGRPFVVGSFGNGTQAEFLVDTGAEGWPGAVRADLFERLSSAGELAVIEPRRGGEQPRFHTATGSIKTRIGRVASFSLGRYSRYTHANLLFAVGPWSNEIGLGYLSRYVVTFDFPGSVMYLRPSRSFMKEDVDRDFTTFLVSRTDGRTTVYRIYDAKIAGKVSVGDDLVNLNGKPVSDMSLYAVRRALATDALQRIDFRRDGMVRHEVLDFRDEQPTTNGGASEAKATQ